MDADRILTSFLFSILFLLTSLFFASFETATTTLGRTKLKECLTGKIPEESPLRPLLETPAYLANAFLACTLFCQLSGAVLFGGSFLYLFKISSTMGFLGVGLLASVILMFWNLLVVSSVSRGIGLKYAEEMVNLYAWPVLRVLWLITPVVMFFSRMIQKIGQKLGVSLSDIERGVAHAEVQALVQLANTEGVLEEREREMIHSIFEFSKTIVREIMTPRTDAVCIDVNSTVVEAVQLIQEKGHSRIPVYEDNIDNLLGLLYAKDLLGLSAKNYQSTLHRFMREAIFIPETTMIEHALHQMKKAKCHIALVVDEYGGTSGLVTLEDVIEEIVGDIQDEYDKDANPEFVQIAKGHFLVDARMNMDDLGEKIQVQFPTDEDYDTIGGFALAVFSKFPAKGEHVEVGGLKITVKEVSNRRLLKLELQKISKS